MLEIKNIYRSREVKFYDYFQSKKQDLIDDFLKQNPRYTDTTVAQSFSTVTEHQKRAYDDGAINKQNGWQIGGIKTQLTATVVEENRPHYPTGFAMLEHFGEACTMAGYSSFEPNTILRRHTGPENRDAKRIRIHIPLIIPQGDVGFEVHGEEIRWDDIFAFDNQKAHSAWNLTSERRLIFIIDLMRNICDIPQGVEWFPGCNDNAPRFPKTEYDGEVWKSTVNFT